MNPLIRRMAVAMFPDAWNNSLNVNMDRALMAGRQQRALARAERGFAALPKRVREAAATRKEPKQ